MAAVFVLAAWAAAEEKTLKVPGNVVVSVRTLSGDIRVTGWDNSGEILVKSRVDGPGVKPVVEQKEGRVTISEGRDNPAFFGGGGSVHFEIMAPRGAVVEGKSVSGTISLDGLQNRLDFKTVSGDIVVRNASSSDVELKSVSGDIDCQVSAPFSAVLAVESVSGNVSVAFLKGCDARFRADSIGGDIDSKMKLQEVEKKEGFGFTRFSGRQGNGTGKVELKTIGGNIEIR